MADRFAEARKRLASEIGDAGLAVVPAATELIRSNDVTFDFHQDPDFLYLTGFPEPDAIALLAPGHPDGEYVLFVRPRNPEEEVWNGYRAGTDGAKERYGADASFEIGEFADVLERYMRGRDVVWYTHGNPGIDSTVDSAIGKARRNRNHMGIRVPTTLADLSGVVGEMRLTKTAEEQQLLMAACELSARGHVEAMRYTRPGLYEYQVQAALEFLWRRDGSRHNGYPSIVASGSNACILHYVDNDRQAEDGDLMLIDAAAEIEGYSSDITRTYPVNGRFSGAQRALYEVVLATEQRGIEVAVPGSSFQAIDREATRVLTEGLVDLGLLPRSVEDSLAMHHYREFFFHGVGHWLGLDVHDTGAGWVEGVPRVFEPGMAFTVEPGLYIAPDKTKIELALLEYDREEWMQRRLLEGAKAAAAKEKEAREQAEKITHDVPPEFLGLGIRIEDDVLVTIDGNVTMSASVPVEIDEIEALCAEESALPLP